MKAFFGAILIAVLVLGAKAALDDNSGVTSTTTDSITFGATDLETATSMGLTRVISAGKRIFLI